MTIAEQIHNSKTHKRGLDPACPICNACLPSRRTLAEIIRSLERCAFQNELDTADRFAPRNAAQAKAVASEQRRIIALLKRAQEGI
jgi:hypothetical protein